MILSNKARNQTVLIREDFTCLSRNSEKNLLLCPFLLGITHDFSAAEIRECVGLMFMKPTICQHKLGYQTANDFHLLLYHKAL